MRASKVALRCKDTPSFLLFLIINNVAVVLLMHIGAFSLNNKIKNTIKYGSNRYKV